jgi:hypothetical protein
MSTSDGENLRRRERKERAPTKEAELLGGFFF